MKREKKKSIFSGFWRALPFIGTICFLSLIYGVFLAVFLPFGLAF